MRINVHVKLRAHDEKVEKTVIQRLTGPEEQYRVSVKELPVEGRANEAIVRVLAEHFKVPKSRVRILAGQSSREKIVEIE